MSKDSEKSGGEVFFRFLVKGALALGVFALIFIVVNFIKSTYLPHAPQMPSAARVQADLRTMQTGLETYWIDNEAYPPELWSLTTPIAYLLNLSSDSFSEKGAEPIIYYTDGEGYILVSRGPDRIPQILPKRDFHYVENRETIAPALLDKMYDPSNGSVSAGDIFRIGPKARDLEENAKWEKGII